MILFAAIRAFYFLLVLRRRGFGSRRPLPGFPGTVQILKNTVAFFFKTGPMVRGTASRAHHDIVALYKPFAAYGTWHAGIIDHIEFPPFWAARRIPAALIAHIVPFFWANRKEYGVLFHFFLQLAPKKAGFSLFTSRYLSFIIKNKYAYAPKQAANTI